MLRRWWRWKQRVPTHIRRVEKLSNCRRECTTVPRHIKLTHMAPLAGFTLVKGNAEFVRGDGAPPCRAGVSCDQAFLTIIIIVRCLVWAANGGRHEAGLVPR